jgi:cytosine/adenosine deaminase-related metal-dependent hydrolase
MIVLKNVTFIDWKTFKFTFGNILVSTKRDTPLKFIDNINDYPDAEVLDCKGKYVTKSFGNAHHHAYTATALGMLKPNKELNNFYEILTNLWWKFDRAIDSEVVKYSAYATAIACAKNGTTFVINHHSGPNAIKDSLQIITDAFNRVGINSLLCYEISDRDGSKTADKALKETENYLENNQGLVGLHASFTVTDKTLKKAVKLAEKYNTGIHVHVAEDLYDQDNCYNIYNKRVVERFNDFGILNLPKSLFAHCLYLTMTERELIKESGIFIVQNTESNLNNNVGLFNSKKLGDNIMLGTDGMHSDMLRTAKATFLSGQYNDTIDIEGAYARMRNIHKYLSLSGFLGDSDNNLVILDYNPATEFNQSNFLRHFIYGIDSTHIQHVISNGKIIVKNRKVTTVDEDEIKSISRELSLKLQKKIKF